MYQQMSLHLIMRLLSPHVWILSAAVTDVGPKKVAVFLWQNSVSGPKKISCWDHWDRVTGIHTKPPIMPFFSEFRSVHSMFLECMVQSGFIIFDHILGKT